MSIFLETFAKAVLQWRGRPSPASAEKDTYKKDDVKAGIIYLRDILLKYNRQASWPRVTRTPTEDSQTLFNQVFLGVALRKEMSRDHIKQQMNIIYERLIERGLITSTQTITPDLMTRTIINGATRKDEERLILDIVRYKQAKLETPTAVPFSQAGAKGTSPRRRDHLHVVRAKESPPSPDNE